MTLIDMNLLDVFHLLKPQKGDESYFLEASHKS